MDKQEYQYLSEYYKKLKQKHNEPVKTNANEHKTKALKG